MTLTTSELKAFAQATMHIKPNGIMPILDYILWDGSTLTKTNLSSYAKYTISSNIDKPVLLEERVLYALVNNTQEEEIEVIITDKEITYKTPKRKVSHMISDTVDYPKFPDNDITEGVTLNTDVLKSLGIAANFADDKTTNFQYVYSTSNDIFATDNFTMYFKQFDCKIPELTLSKEACKIVSSLDAAIHTCNANIDFFTTDNIVYGFVQNHVKRATYYNAVSGIDKSGGYLIPLSAIKSFCNGVKALSKNAENVCTIEGNGIEILLSYNNSGEGKIDTMNLPIAVMFNPFKFEASKMLDAINLPYQNIYFNPFQDKAIIHTDEDSNYMGFIGARL